MNTNSSSPEFPPSHTNFVWPEVNVDLEINSLLVERAAEELDPILLGKIEEISLTKAKEPRDEALSLMAGIVLFGSEKGISQTELVDITGISRPTVGFTFNYLRDTDLVYETDLLARKTGRPRQPVKPTEDLIQAAKLYPPMRDKVITLELARRLNMSLDQVAIHAIRRVLLEEIE